MVTSDMDTTASAHRKDTTANVSQMTGMLRGSKGTCAMITMAMIVGVTTSTERLTGVMTK
jgi:hypothetical protein